jgi:hypothetical protein
MQQICEDNHDEAKSHDFSAQKLVSIKDFAGSASNVFNLN